MAKKMRSFRSKMVMLFALSMILAAGVTYLIYEGLRIYYKLVVRYEEPLAQFRSIVRQIGDINFFLIIFIPLSIMFFFFLTRPYLKYFDEISSGIHHLANGDFTKQVQVSSNDEFGNIAREKLKEAVERGDFAENSKDQLVVNLAHDLRTPLTSVLGYLDLILKDENLSKEQIKHFATIAYTKSQRLESLIDELFEITRMNYGMLKLDKKPIDISELLIQLDEELYPLLEKHHLEARMHVDPHLPINGDGKLLARVFENLLTNAVRYGYDGQFVDMNGYVDNGEVVVQIINYGDSIPEEDLPYLFDMFYTGDKARSEDRGGTGLGLFIAKNIIEQHNGTISAESNIVKTIFEVRLPKNENLTI
ncbi:HAMP domain-containing sensor histidine kinase [Bacillus toyonensis]|uniref:histidine kinase n=1 Tax=Bacillus toyonensis TaxID=155322 RepID=A0A2B5XJL1_9BACI|nr:HAMP domain-containing sensor histidine kinase [Bacillus toyonensis]PGA96565.1 vancomycin resistance histidine kinase VanS [Bacillus toyonensis]PHD74882.1 vancomycin resistance histidine kinase VanS [Bacillus toyonensis]